MEQQPTPDAMMSDLAPGPALLFGLNPGEELAGCAGAVFAHRAKDEHVTVILLSDGRPDAPKTAPLVLTRELTRVRETCNPAIRSRFAGICDAATLATERSC